MRAAAVTTGKGSPRAASARKSPPITLNGWKYSNEVRTALLMYFYCSFYIFPLRNSIIQQLMTVPLILLVILNISKLVYSDSICFFVTKINETDICVYKEAMFC